jgi:hypothetical protein
MKDADVQKFGDHLSHLYIQGGFYRIASFTSHLPFVLGHMIQPRTVSSTQGSILFTSGSPDCSQCPEVSRLHLSVLYLTCDPSVPVRCLSRARESVDKSYPHVFSCCLFLGWTSCATSIIVHVLVVHMPSGRCVLSAPA